MFSRPSSRLVAIKFLGLFGSQSVQQTLDKELDRHDSTTLIQTKTPATRPTQTSSPSTGLANNINLSSRSITGLMLEKGIPGVTVCVAKEGQVIWTGAFGFCDVENQLECRPEARMRIASVSKSLFASTVIAPMVEENKLDIEASVHNYLTTDEFPKQKKDGQEIDITVHQLLTHTSGIKHYSNDKKELNMRPIGSNGSQHIYQSDDQYNRLGFYQRETYRNVMDALQPFKDGPLAGEPGKYLYTTYGYTLLSAVAEKVLMQTASNENSKKEQIEDFWVKVLRKEWDMKETSLDQDEPILPNRAKYYLRSSFNGGLINAPYADNSVKWAGGGLISTVGDLVKFGSSLVDAYKGKEAAKLKQRTVELLWTENQSSYCLGFQSKQWDCLRRGGDKRVIYHTGSANGASSILIILPESETVVALLANLNAVDLYKVGSYIAEQFA